jgi:hypothetical protein
VNKKRCKEGITPRNKAAETYKNFPLSTKITQKKGEKTAKKSENSSSIFRHLRIFGARPTRRKTILLTSSNRQSL